MSLPSRAMYTASKLGYFYVESESSDRIYYFVKYNPSEFEWWCSCKDYDSNRGFKKCKHIFGVEFAIRWGTLRDTNKLPHAAAAGDVKKRDTQTTTTTITKATATSKSYKDEDYSF